MSLTALVIADDVHPALYDHFDPDRWRGIDLILSAGDLPPDYLDYLCTRLGVPLLYVRGNHDGCYGRERYHGGENLHGRILSYRGVRFAGLEGCRRYNHGLVQYTEREMRRLSRRMRIRAIRRGTPDVMLTHAPPLGCHDAPDGCHRGFAAFNSLIDAWRPGHFVHGHSHTHYGRSLVSQVRDTMIINAFPYRVIEIPEPPRAVEPPMRRLQRVRRSLWRRAGA